MLLVSVNPTVFIFIINTSVHPFIKSKYDLREVQVLIKRDDYQFLDHDSYIDCHELINHFSIEEIKKQLLYDMDRIKGKISSITRNNILISVNNCRALSRAEKNIIVDGMNSIVF